VQVDGLAQENLQARVRAVIWMALSNHTATSFWPAATSRSWPPATPRSTATRSAATPPSRTSQDAGLGAGALAQRAGAPNGQTPPIPEGVITKPPSAELRPGQLDSDSLPEYSLLDAVLDAYVEQDRGTAELLDMGFDAELVERVIGLVDRAEYKRRQYPPGPKTTARNFGRDRRLPITNRWREHL
jgi:NAD+ synthase (glutamine-hydrolysing)